jgi:hypothetical protein
VVLGNERTGTLEFPVYNDLTITETAFMAANGAKNTAFTYTSKTALKIARVENAKPIDTHNFVSKVLVASMGGQVNFTEVELAWQVKYIRELEETAFKVLELSVMQQQVLVTCVIRHRLPGMHEWNPEDTASLPSELCEAIYEFALKEQGRGEDFDKEGAVEEVAEMLGKSKTEPTEESSTPTGETSSTSSETSTPAPKSSRRKRSASSKAATSSSASEKEAG